MENSNSYTAFAGSQQIERGTLEEVARAVHHLLRAGESRPLLIFDDESQPAEIDLRGSEEEVIMRIRKSKAALAAASSTTDSAEERDRVMSGPGRPKLGVVAREVTLLPRHWEWLNSQPGGASVTIRKLVEEARRAKRDEPRKSKEVTYRFISAMAGNERGFEEAARALFANDREKFDRMMASWPKDIRKHAQRLAQSAFLGVTYDTGRD